MKKCPYCEKEIQDKAILCRYCKSNLSESNVEPHELSVSPFTPGGNDHSQAEYEILKKKKKNKIAWIITILVVICCFILNMGLGLKLFYEPRLISTYDQLTFTNNLPESWEKIERLEPFDFIMEDNSREVYISFIRNNKSTPNDIDFFSYNINIFPNVESSNFNYSIINNFEKDNSIVYKEFIIDDEYDSLLSIGFSIIEDDQLLNFNIVSNIYNVVISTGSFILVDQIDFEDILLSDFPDELMDLHLFSLSYFK